jgi:amidohydrolase
MHACGHDGHIAMGIILAKIFMDNRDMLKGNIKFIFQPAEEEGDGALKMLDAGVLDPKPDYMVSGHLWPEIETGKIDITDKITFAASDIIEVTIKGKGGHGALPHTVKDSLYAGSKVAIALKDFGIELNEKGMKNILSVCSFDCKSQYNIFKNDAFLLGTLRTVDSEHREYIISEMKKICDKIADEIGLEIECNIKVDCPALVNDSSLVEITRKALEEKMGNDIFVDFGPVMASEDFSYFSNLVPSVHLKIGSGGEGAVCPVLHNSRYELDERSLIIGVEAIYTIIEKILKI